MIFLYIVLIYFLYLISAVFIGKFIKLREDKKSEKVNQYIENEFNKFVSDKIKYNKLMYWSIKNGIFNRYLE